MRNRIIKEKRLGISILTIALTVLLLLTACAPASTVGGKTVQIGHVDPYTGAGSVSVQLVGAGLQDYIRYFNEQEAIPGVNIEVVWADSMRQFPQWYTHYQRFVERGIPVIVADDTQGLTTPNFEKDGVVALAAGGTQEASYPPDWRYAESLTNVEQAAAVMNYFMENWQEERPPRFAFIVMDSAWAYEVEDGGTKYAQSLGFEVLPKEVVPFVVLDATPQLLRLKDEGADLVYIQGLAPSSGPTLRDTERLGLLGQIQFAGHASSMGERVIEMAGVASEGYLIARAFPSFAETEVPGIKLMLDNQMEYHGKEMREDEYIHGWVRGVIACEAIKRAIENVGYENVDGVAIKEALDSFQDFDVYGLCGITYTPEDHRGNTKIAIYEVRDGKLVRVTDWLEAPMLVPEE
jgi:branched-chain amino acid transport system substrate-binding protein